MKRMFVLTVSIAACFLAIPANAQAQNIILVAQTPTATVGAGDRLTGWSAQMTGKGFAETPDFLKNSTFSIEYFDPQGHKIDTVTVTSNADGVVRVPPPAPPIFANVVGSSMRLNWSGQIGGGAAWGSTIMNYSAGTWKGVPTPPPLPTLTTAGIPGAGTQNWAIGTVGFSMDGTDSFLGSTSLSVVASGFYLSYSPVVGTLYNVFVSGDDSFMRLSNDTYLAFADGSSFGTIDIGGGSFGSFNYSAIGWSGSWVYDPQTNSTTAIGTSFDPFSAPALSVVPEPSTYVMALAGVACSGWHMLRRRRAG
jgi:PEP-CTERM motif